MKTFSPRPRDIERRWYVVDAVGVVLGRRATHVASILRGKHKPIYAPHADTGDHVIVVNARGIRVTDGKEFEKIYYRHSGYPGGLRRIGYEGLLAERPALAVEKAIGGMLPKTRLGRQMLTKLSVYEGPEHPHQAQQPVALGLGEIPRWEGLPTPKPPQPAKAKPSTSTAKSVRGAKGKTEASGARAASRARTATRGSATKAKGEGRTAKGSEETARAPRGRRSGAKGAESAPDGTPAKQARATRKAKAEESEKAKSKGSEESKDTKGTSRRSRTKKES
jgi:large subunit ribosomal protein L13